MLRGGTSDHPSGVGVASPTKRHSSLMELCNKTPLPKQRDHSYTGAGRPPTGTPNTLMRAECLESCTLLRGFAT
eukprot:8293480-Lingulodinium_polyedra.AAC.1